MSVKKHASESQEYYKQILMCDSVQNAEKPMGKDMWMAKTMAMRFQTETRTLENYSLFMQYAVKEFL